MEEPKVFHGNVLVRQGLVLVQTLIGLDEAEQRAAIKLLEQDYYQVMLKAALFYEKNNREPESLDDLLGNFWQARLDDVIAAVKIRIGLRLIKQDQMNHFRESHRKLQEQQALRDRLAKTNKPDPMGTVDELAKKFNKSKSEIRRLKAEGLLHTLEAPSP